MESDPNCGANCSVVIPFATILQGQLPDGPDLASLFTPNHDLA